ncbi:hydantoinase/oxoprolinase family protein [Chelatococcus sp. GCM10030263]|uniref:hydantoinase/oxoprolinase family protein n=1 Tax=Chelatococcus sp. GCM10030263 TaxID=3273387 RepID=UPI00360A0E43
MSMMPQGSDVVIGWDLGGIHVKAARIVAGRVEAVVQAPCLLWRGPVALDEALAGLPEWTREHALHAVTMTGELADFFSNRAEGVGALVDWAKTRLTGPVAIYGGRAEFLPPDAVPAHVADIASANWHATAGFVGRAVGEALLVDIGSTTTDIIPIAAGLPAAAGYTDAERLATGELVYTGLVRTPLVALASQVPFGGRLVSLMAEYFATTADVYRLLGRLPEEADQQEAADGKGKSLAETCVRLARMVGHDAGEASDEAWRDLAAHFAELQLRRIHDAATQVLSGRRLPDDAPVIACGVGTGIVEALAGRLNRPCRNLAELVPAEEGTRGWTASCAPAVAVGLLASSVELQQSFRNGR